jgi:hypothetical protein
MGYEVHGEFARAIADFCSAETGAHRLGGSLAAFWEARMLTKSDLDLAEIALANASSQQ